MSDESRFLDLVPDQIMEGYSNKALDHAQNPWNYGRMENATSYAKIKGICGDSMEIWLRIEDNIVKEARFNTDGCLSTKACGSMMTCLVKEIEIMDALRISPTSLIEELGEIPETHCAILTVSTLYRALAEYLLETEGHEH
ncbi:MAG TPA: iron-sulfur cluster assembly scaffold protein [bacterium]|nr:iron-sulfur cluster assembly scaffold protein [bacterium]